MKIFLIKFLILHFIIRIKATFYLSMELLGIDDCIVEIIQETQEKNITLFEFPNFTERCVSFPPDYPNPIISMIPYNFGDIIYFKFYNGEVEAYFNMTVYLDEYIIKTEHQKFWRCLDCFPDENNKFIFGNYIFNEAYNRFDFFPYKLSYNPYFFYKYFNFIFQINNFSELNYEGNEINDNYYSFIDNENYNYVIVNTEEEIELINFNDTDYFYINKNQSMPTPYEDLRFRIYYAESLNFSGKFIGLDHEKKDIELYNESFFEVSKNKGLRYKFSPKEKFNKNIYLKIKLQSYNSIENITLAKPNSQIYDFNFFIQIEIKETGVTKETNDTMMSQIREYITSKEINNYLKNETGYFVNKNNTN